MTQIIDGRTISERVRTEVAARVREFAATKGRSPGLATILVGDDRASAVYVASKQKATAAVGMAGFEHHLCADTSTDDLATLIEELNADPAVDGILCQLPLPPHLDSTEIPNLIDPRKDVDGLTIANAGKLALGLPGLRPCTPAGVMILLEEAGAELRGAHAVVLGRSNLFGKPMAQLLMAANATVTSCHSSTRALPATCHGADVLIAAVGRPGLVQRDWIKPGAIVIDVGINRMPAGLVGDVDFGGALGVAAAITPVPGGVGPMTIACLLRNTLQAAESTTKAPVAA